MIPDFDALPSERARVFRLPAGGDRGVQIDPGLREAFVASPQATNNLDRLFTPGSLCVTTGQQPGLFTGPLFTIYKALSAVALARRCERTLGRPVVPVFWVAGDDHDFAEANHIDVLSTTQSIERLELRTRAPDALSTPLYREPLGSEIDQVLAQFEEITPQSEFRSEVTEWLRRHYNPANDLATAFAEALAELLSRHGLLVFQPTSRAAKEVTAPWVITALEHALEVNEGLLAQAQQMQREGQGVPVPILSGNTPVMIEGKQGRDRLVMDGSAAFRTRRSQERWGLDELKSLAHTEPERLSANVLLRPVVEAAILPTIAYVAGPGELAYLPQAEPLYEILGVHPQDAVPRWSARIVENRTRKTLDRYAINPDELLAQDGQLEARLVQDGIPEEARAAFAALRDTIEITHPQLLKAAITIDPTLEKRVHAARQGMLTSLADVEKRIVSHLKQRDEVAIRQVANARSVLFPLGQPQERVFNVSAYLVRYGWKLLDGALAACEDWANDLEAAPQHT
jgi:bacillithiol biosynthesis cysteine-adding enzyme BshC